jgi:hypothetical protein
MSFFTEIESPNPKIHMEELNSPNSQRYPEQKESHAASTPISDF